MIEAPVMSQPGGPAGAPMAGDTSAINTMRQLDPMQQKILQVAHQSLSPEEFDTFASAMTPEVVEITAKLFGANAANMLVPFMVEYQSKMAQSGAENNDVDALLMQGEDTIHGTDGDMPSPYGRDENDYGPASGIPAVNRLRAY